MQSFHLLVLIIGISILVSVLIGTWIGSTTPSTIGDGQLSQGPLTYMLLVVFLLGIGFVFSRLYNRMDSNHSFSFRGFLNVGFASIIIGGIIHEVVHMILLRHPTQFQVHFGDPVAIFSTCCLAPGELPNEELAYGIQLLVMIAWFILNRGLIFHSIQLSAVVNEKSAKEPARHVEHTQAKEKEAWTEQSLEKEWEKSRQEINESLKKME